MKKIKYCYPQGKTKALTFSYDDGVTADKRLIEIFDSFGLKSTFHLNGGLFDYDKRITAGDVAGLYKNHEVSCHSYTHPHLEQLNNIRIVNEIIEDRRKLESLVKYPVTGASYPYGGYNETVIKAMRSCGIVYSRTTVSTEKFSLPDDFMRWHPTCHHKNNLLTSLWQRFLQSSNQLDLFYLWGHSYEFDDDDNWQLIEDFCAKAHGCDNIYYASNIDIYNYINTVRNLQFSMEEDLVYNPGAISVYLDCDSKIIEVESGQTTNIK